MRAHFRNCLPARTTLSDVAAALSVSVSALCHKYRQETGQSLMQDLLRIRTELAKPLLRKGYPLKQIADQLGFSDAFHLSKTFKRVVGQSPRDFLHQRKATLSGGGSVARSRAIGSVSCSTKSSALGRRSWPQPCR